MARKRHRHERRIRILDAAVEVFAGHGYAGAKMQDIAARAGVVPSVLYDHFASKRELHVTFLELHAQQLRERALRPLEGVSVEELVRESIASYFEFVEEDPFIWRVLHQDPPAETEIAAVITRDRRPRDRQASPTSSDSARADAKSIKGITLDEAAWILARATQSANDGVARWWYDNRDVPRERVVELVFMLLWQGFDGMLKQASAD